MAATGDLGGIRHPPRQRRHWTAASGFTESMTVSTLSNHRRNPPDGMAGALGVNRVVRADGTVTEMGSLDSVEVYPGDMGPGGGGYGSYSPWFPSYGVCASISRLPAWSACFRLGRLSGGLPGPYQDFLCRILPDIQFQPPRRG